MIQYAQNKGAKGIKLAGMCCTANEVLMRHGVPVAGNFLQQELAIVTGAVDAMVVDVQCEMQALANVAKCYHTKLITTDDRAKIEGAGRCTSSSTSTTPWTWPGRSCGMAIDNFPNRQGPGDDPVSQLPDAWWASATRPSTTCWAAPSGDLLHPERQHHQRPDPGRGRRGGLQQLPHHPRQRPPDHDQGADEERRHRPDHRLRRHGLRQVRAADPGGGAASTAGPGLAEVCETVGIPPVLHMGACVDNSRILMAATAWSRTAAWATTSAICPPPARRPSG